MDTKYGSVKNKNVENGCMTWMLLSLLGITCGLLFPIVIPLIGFIIICFFFILDIIRIKTKQRLILKNFCNEFFSIYYSLISLLIIFGRLFIVAFDINIISVILGINLQFLIIFLSIIVGFGDVIMIELIDRKNFPKIGLDFHEN